MKRIKISWWEITLLLLILKLIMVQNQPYYAHYEAVHDDTLMVEQASSILQGDWLGPYYERTLIKGPLMPIILSITGFFGLSFFHFQSLLYGLACLFFTVVLHKKIASKWFLLLFYSLLLWDPISYSTSFFRLYRDGLYSCLLLFLLGFLILWWSHFKDSPRKQILPSLGVGFTTAFLSLCREEFFVLLPLFLFFVGYFLWQKQKIPLLFLPIVCVLFLRVGVGFINYQVYRTTELNDYTASYFQEAYASLVSVKQEPKVAYVPLTKKTMYQLFQVSPTFAELKGYFEQNQGWFELSEIKNEMDGANFFWALRAAVASKGYYDTPIHAKQYYQRLTKELHSLCQSGTLTCESHKTLIVPLTPNQLWKFPASFWKVLSYQYHRTGIDVIIPPTPSSYQQNLEGSYQIAHHPLSSPASYQGIVASYEVNIRCFLNVLYRLLSPILFWCSILSAIGLFLFRILKKQTTPLFFPIFSILLLALSKLITVAYTYQTAYKSACNSMYLSSTYALTTALSLLLFYSFIQIVLKQNYFVSKSQKN